MKAFTKLSVGTALIASIIAPSFFLKAQKAQAEVITTTATGYTKASDVEYDDSGKYLANWGARGEDCLFLSESAQTFYTGSYQYSVLSMKSGGTTQSNAPSGALYSALKSMMTEKHSYQTSYKATKDMYRYTDCVSNHSDKISSFYSGKTLNGAWDSAKTWNREHTWPNSKGLGGKDETDIMMLRPTSVSENSSRGNTAYGESGAYYDPGESVRGDCARICLYVYVRWGNTSKMWGTGGVMESLSVLLKWMEEDPVDTWEMGRNDVVESITGTRNVFVDYPEYAWLLFGRDIPDDVTTPSGIAKNGKPTDSSSSDSSSSSSNNSSSNNSSSSDSSSSDSSSSDSSSSDSIDSSSSEVSSVGCEHEYSDWYTIKQPTEREEGKETCVCTLCGNAITRVIPKLEGDSVNEEELISAIAANCNATITAPLVGVSVLTMAGALFFKKRKND